LTTLGVDWRPAPGARVVVLSGAGLSAASGVPTFRSDGGLWRGHRFEDLATPAAWRADPDRVRAFYDWRRERVLAVVPNDGHRALISLQAAWGGERVTLVTQNVDGLLQRAAAELGVAADVIEMHGSLLRSRCERDGSHPRPRTWEPAPGGAGRLDPRQDPGARCVRCHAAMRPAVVWFGEVPHALDRIAAAVASAQVFVAVGTSGVVYPAAGLVQLARRAGAVRVEVNPEPTGGDFDVVVAAGAERALPELVSSWSGVRTGPPRGG
jgi:NAD-dependent deacetylase